MDPKTGAASRRHTIAWLAALALPAAASAAQPKPWPTGSATPALDLPAYDGTRWSLAGARGRVVLLNFWATWCEPCRTEMPGLELLAQRHEGDALDVIAVNYRETDAAIARFLALMPVTLNIVRDVDGAAARAFGARIFPTTIAVARNGRAAWSLVGEADWTGSEARRWIEPLLR